MVVASVHSKLRMDERAMTERMVLAIASPHVDILGHCTGRKVSGFGPDQRVIRPQATFDAEIVFAACARFDTAVEINCRPERQDPTPIAARNVPSTTLYQMTVLAARIRPLSSQSKAVWSGITKLLMSSASCSRPCRPPAWAVSTQ